MKLKQILALALATVFVASPVLAEAKPQPTPKHQVAKKKAAKKVVKAQKAAKKAPKKAKRAPR